MEAHRGQEAIGLKSLQDMWSDSWTTLAIIGSTDCAPSYFFFREIYSLYNGPKGYIIIERGIFMSKFIDFIGEVADYIFRHCCAIIITGLVISIGFLNPFVVEKYQMIYSYPVTKTGATVWDIVFIVMIVIVWNVDKYILKTLKIEKDK